MAESLETGLVLMAAGMGTVFALLTMLVWMVRGVSKICRSFDPQTPVVGPPPPAAATNDELITVIGAAISAFKRDGGSSR